MPEASVAAEIKLACADAAYGHADEFEVTAAQNLPCAALEKRFHPFRPEFLVGGDNMVKILARERSGHDRQAGKRQTQGRGSGGLEEPPAMPVSSNGEDYLRDRKAQWQSLSVPFSFFFFVDCAQKRVHGSGVRQGVCLLGLETCWCYSREKLNAFSCFAVHSYAEAFEQNS
jgi:hypothetical protein